MLLLARSRRPKVRWWWGVQWWHEPHVPSQQGPPPHTQPVSTDRVGRRGAWCYLCDKPIATWSGMWPVPEHAKAAIAVHRSDHIQGRLDTSPTTHGDER
jgi:hypothetical protein